jgi:hypothetical protein
MEPAMGIRMKIAKQTGIPYIQTENVRIRI